MSKNGFDVHSKGILWQEVRTSKDVHFLTFSVSQFNQTSRREMWVSVQPFSRLQNQQETNLSRTVSSHLSGDAFLGVYSDCVVILVWSIVMFNTSEWFPFSNTHTQSGLVLKHITLGSNREQHAEVFGETLMDHCFKEEIETSNIWERALENLSDRSPRLFQELVLAANKTCMMCPPIFPDAFVGASLWT